MNGAYATSAVWFWLAFFLFLLVIFLLLTSGRRMKRAEKYAVSDAVSGALNSEGFRRSASRLLSSAVPQYVLVAAELRNYRQLTQTFGGEMCDQVLVYLTKTLRKTLGSSEPVARINRGTFCFLMKNRERDAIVARLTRIYENANQFNQNLEVPYPMDLVFGVYMPENAQETLSVMQEKAFEMLDLDKDAPRYRFYTAAEKEKAGARWKLIEQMNQSLANGDFIVFMQPKIRLGDNRVVGAEALARWRHPQRGMLTPEMFIPLLEEYRLIHRFDQCLFEMVCQKLVEWKQNGWDTCPVSVNLSLQTLERDSFLEPYIRLIQKYRVAPELIEFELSEPILFEKPEKLRTLIDEIHSYGFQCSLDHFGQSAIPLQLLRQLEVDTVKLDRSFFTGENNSRPNRYIVEAILKITSQLQIRTVAEGIDNASQVEYLRQSGCDIIQGFYYFRPMPIEEFQKAVFDEGHLRYVENNDSRARQLKETPVHSGGSGSNIIMFSFMESLDRVIFSDVFSPLLYGQFTVSEASALFGHSDLIHENDRKDFFQLLERCHKEEGWVKNTLRFYTSEARYEWLEVHVHRESISSTGENVISGVLVNMANWKNEVNRWMEKANRDPLTGLYNREFFEQTASSAIAKGTMASGAIVFFDLDNFKQVNDTLGHMGGDDALCFIAKCLLGTFRHTDVVARYGGDEFVVFVNEIERYDLEKRLQELCNTLRTPYRNGDINYRLSGSIGAAMFPHDASNYPDLLDHADTATYVAKERGKAQFVMYTPDMAMVTKTDIR